MKLDELPEIKRRQVVEFIQKANELELTKLIGSLQSEVIINLRNLCNEFNESRS